MVVIGDRLAVGAQATTIRPKEGRRRDPQDEVRIAGLRMVSPGDVRTGPWYAQDRHLGDTGAGAAIGVGT